MNSFELLNESLFFHAFHHAAIGMALVDTNGRFLKVNHSFCMLVGYAPEELQNITFQEITHPDDVVRDYHHFTQILNGATQTYQTEKRYIHKDGFHVWVSLTASLLRDQNNLASFFVVQVQDISERKKAEIKQMQLMRQLRESEKRYRILAENSLDMIVRCHPDATFLYVSPASEKLVGFRPDELLGTKSFDHIHPEELDQILRLYSDGDSPDERVATFRFQTKNGSYIWIEATCKRIRSKKTGKIIEYVGVFRDITGRKRKQQQLRKAEELYQLISQNSQDVIMYTTPVGVVKYISPAVHTLLGYTPEELIGNNYMELYHPDDAAALLQRIFKDEDVCVCRVRHRNGSYIWFETAVKFIRNEEGEIEKVLSVGRDITERKQAEDRYKRIVEQSPDAILIGVAGRWAYANETAVELFGAKSSEELLQVEPLALIHPDYREAAIERRNLVEQLMVAELTESKYLRLDGQVIDVEVKSIPTLFNGEAAIHTIVRDVTERKITQQLLQQSEKLTLAGQFAAGIAHEIRNPLTSIKGFLQLMQSTADYKLHYFKIMLDELNRIETILSELLLLAKPQSKNYQLKNAIEIIASVVSLLETQAILNDIQIQTYYDTDKATIYCDENQLKQVFINLIKNAIEAMPEGGVIKIEAISGEKDIVIRFTDQGYGIPKEKLPRVGQPFYTTKDTGTGLGLSVSFSIIEAHQGNIYVSSKVNEGTIFTVTLPSFTLHDFWGKAEAAVSEEQ